MNKAIKTAIEHELYEKIYENYEKEIEELGIWNVKGTMKISHTDIVNRTDITTLKFIKKQIEQTKIAFNELIESLSSQPNLRNRVKINIETELDMLSGDVEYKILNYEEEKINAYVIEGTAEVSCEYEDDEDYMLDEFKIKFKGEATEIEGLNETYEVALDYKED